MTLEMLFKLVFRKHQADPALKCAAICRTCHAWIVINSIHKHLSLQMIAPALMISLIDTQLAHLLQYELVRLPVETPKCGQLQGRRLIWRHVNGLDLEFSF